ncbi:MAG: peptidylprolyl isomerase [Bdellovibrionota bacterium]
MKYILVLTVTFFAQFSVGGTIVLVETNKGNFEIELNDEKAPVSSENFLKYVDSGFYNGTIFHRAVKNFVVQAGGLTSDMQEKETLAPIPSEAKNGLSNLKGTLGMARTADINSATSQFYVNTKDNTGLDYSSTKAGYTVFGKVISGYEVIEVIENSPVHSVDGYDDVPQEAIVIESMKRK